MTSQTAHICKRILLTSFILFSAQSQANSCRDLFSHFDSASTTDNDKYSGEQVIAYRFSTEGLDAARELYHHIKVPKLIEDILTMNDPDRRRVIDEAPGYYEWNDAGNSILSINPTYTPAEKLISSIKDGSVRSLKDQEGGIALVTWFVQPELLEALTVADGSHSAHRTGTISDYEKNGSRYLVSILDLDVRDIGYLKDLKKMTLSSLTRNYGFDSNRDSVRLDFHFPYSVETATLHLHARVNKPASALERSKSYSIDEVIAYLEAGKSIKQLILDRQNFNGQFYFPMASREILELIPNGSLQIVRNPYLGL